MRITEKKLLQNLSIENKSTNCKGLEISKFVSIHLIKWYQEKRNMYLVIISLFLIKNDLGQTKNKRT